MKYIVVYKAKNRKNAVRHVVTSYGRTVYFNSVEEAKKCYMFSNEHYDAAVMTANYRAVEE